MHTILILICTHAAALVVGGWGWQKYKARAAAKLAQLEQKL